MSHVTDVKMKVRDLDALEAACEALGLELQRDKKTYAWWGNFVGDSAAYGEHRPEDMGKCDHAIRVKGTEPKNGSSGPWEIAVVAAKDGDGFNLFYDQFGSAGQRLTERVGPDSNRLRVEYSAATTERRAIEKLSRHGWRAVREAQPNGGMRVTLRKR